MNPVDAIGMALTPGSVFNQQDKIFRSAKALAQFANVPQNEVLGLIADNLADRVTIRPSQKRPENGPLVALTEYLPLQEEPALVKIMGGNAVADDQPILEKGFEIGMNVDAPLGMDGGAEALMEKVKAITGQMDEEDVMIEPSYADDVDEEVEMVGIDDPDDEEVA